MKTRELTMDGEDYVMVPRADYLRMTGVKDGSVDAVRFATAQIAGNLRKARLYASLTQAQLAAKISVGQSMVSGAEGGTVDVGEKYILKVLKACGLPKDWAPGKAR